MTEPVHHRVSVASCHEHLFRVESRFPASPDATHLDLSMPAWTPGSYLIREFARHVQGVEAFDDAGGSLAVERLDKATWRVRGEGAISVRYLVYANELTVRTSHLDGTHGYFNGANLFITSPQHRSAPVRLRVETPPGWRAFCALPLVDGAFTARDFDELVDSPVEMGPHESRVFEVEGRPHELVVWGRGNGDLDAFCADLKQLCEAEVRLFGALPVERYLFILHLTDKGRGGLEHAASTTLLFPRMGFAPRDQYEELLSLAAHEYFHLWNVKRIKPRALVPFDYSKESWTRLLWAMEGFTSYYDSLILRRAGLISAERFLERLGETLTTLSSAPARFMQPVDEASLVAWVKLYRQDENTPNSGVSYYVKGEAIAALLDLALRETTGGRRSLDDVMRLLMSRHGDGQGIPEDALEPLILEVAEGAPAVREFLERAIRGVGELDDRWYESAGLRLALRAKQGAADKGGKRGKPQGPTAWLGVELKPGERAIVATTYTGSPAAVGGLYAEDEVIALDGLRVSGAALAERISERRPGDRASLTVFRRDELLTIPVQLSAPRLDACWFEKIDASPAQRQRYAEWLGESFAP